MAKRQYQPKPQPISLQIHIQRARVAQDESALDEARRDAAVTQGTRADMWGTPMTQAQIDRVAALVTIRERQLEDARHRLAELQARET